MRNVRPLETRALAFKCQFVIGIYAQMLCVICVEKTEIACQTRRVYLLMHNQKNAH